MSTLGYYRENAEVFTLGTFSVDFTTTQNRFLKYLAPSSYILDFGCGSGRDTKYFLEHGYEVLATDGCQELCDIASKHTSITVQQMLFHELEAVEMFDGIWACASILHVPSADLPDILQRMCRALKAGGYAYVSFKYGSFEGERNGRYFTDMTEGQFERIIKLIPAITIVEQWVSGDVREGRGDEKWLNVILKKG